MADDGQLLQRRDHLHPSADDTYGSRRVKDLPIYRLGLSENTQHSF